MLRFMESQRVRQNGVTELNRTELKAALGKPHSLGACNKNLLSHSSRGWSGSLPGAEREGLSQAILSVAGG